VRRRIIAVVWQASGRCGSPNTGERDTIHACARLKPVAELDAGQEHAAVGDPKKLVGLVLREVVRRLRGMFKTSERDVYGLLQVRRGVLGD
jgi:hypothetical protein